MRSLNPRERVIATAIIVIGAILLIAFISWYSGAWDTAPG